MEINSLLKQVRFSVELKEMRMDSLKYSQSGLPLVEELGENPPTQAT